jgi:hypothetical protein
MQNPDQGPPQSHKEALEAQGPWTLTLEAWRLTRSRGGSVDHWLQIRNTLTMSSIQIRIRIS